MSTAARRHTISKNATKPMDVAIVIIEEEEDEEEVEEENEEGGMEGVSILPGALLPVIVVSGVRETIVSGEGSVGVMVSCESMP